MNYIQKIFLFICFSPLLFATKELSSSTRHALSSLAPEGHWAIRVEGKYRKTNFSYDNAGKESGIGSQYDNINLDKNIFPSLGVFGDGASFGKTSVDIGLESDYWTFMLGYGLTKSLTVGVILPYREKKINVDFSLESGNLGINPHFNTNEPRSATNSSYLPVSVEGITPMTTNQFQNILSDFGYKPLQSMKVSGLADPTIGFMWNVHKSKEDSLVLSLGYDIAIAKKDDTDSLIATNIGNGNSAMRFRLEYFRDLEYDFDFFTKLEYGEELKDKVSKRVPKKGEFLADKSTTEKLDRKIGNYRVYNIGLGKTWNDYRVSALWHRSEKNRDRYSSSKGTDVSFLEKNSEAFTNQWEGSLSWSGASAWKKGDIPFPMVVNLSYRDTYKGKNALKWKEVFLTVTSFF